MEITGTKLVKPPPLYNAKHFGSHSSTDDSKAWLQSQAILFQGQTPKRIENIISPSHNNINQNSDDDEENDNFNTSMSPDTAKVPLATPPSRWQQMFLNKQQESTPTTTATTATTAIKAPTSSTTTNLQNEGMYPPPPPSPSTFADKSPVSISLMEPLEWDQSTADVDEWIARVKNHSDKIAEEMFERAGLSPPNSVSNADLRFLSRDAATTPPAHYNTAEELAIHEQNQPLENDSENVNDIEIEKETAQEARDILSSWMQMDDEAHRIRVSKKKKYDMEERESADRREDDVIRTKHTHRPVPFEQTLRTDEENNGRRNHSVINNQEDVMLSSLSSLTTTLTEPQRRRQQQRHRNQRELQEQRAEEEASEILSLAERMVLQPLHREEQEEKENNDSTLKQRRTRRQGTTTTIRGRSDPRLMMEARQASIRQKRLVRKNKQLEQDKLMRNMTTEEKRNHRALAERETRKKQRKLKQEQQKQQKQEQQDRHARHEEEENNNTSHRAIVNAQKELQAHRQERQEVMERDVQNRKREALRLKMKKEKDQKDHQFQLKERNRKEHKRRMFITEMIQSRRKQRITKECFTLLLIHTQSKQRRRKRQRKELRQMTKKIYFQQWKKQVMYNRRARKANLTKAMVWYTFRLRSMVFQHWRVYTSQRTEQRVLEQTERILKRKLRSRRIREMAASRLFRNRCLSNTLNVWCEKTNVWKEEREQRVLAEARKQRLVDMLAAERRRATETIETKQNSVEEDNKQKKEKKEKKEKGSTSSSSSTSHHFPKRLPHMQPRTHRNTTATTTAKHATNTTTTKRTGTLPPMPSFQKKEQSSFSFVNAMEARSLERKQKREERRQRYLAADLQKQWYETWKTQISSVIGPDAARAGRMFLRKRQAKIERQKKTMKKNANLLAKQKWATAVIHDAKATVDIWGLQPWKKYVRLQQLRRKTAQRMGWKSVVSVCFDQWQHNVVEVKR